MNVGIVVEGPSDGATYPALLRRMRDDIELLQVRECRGKSRLKRVFIGFLKEFDRNHAWGINAGFVIRDSDCKPPQQIEDELRGALRDSGFNPHFPVDFFAARCQLETWLLADEGAITHVSQVRGKNKQVRPVEIQFEADNKAKTYFREQLLKAGLPIDPKVYREIAEVADFERIGNRCPYFQQFVRRIRAY